MREYETQEPPHCELSEQGLIGCCLNDPTGHVLNLAISKGVTAEAFYAESHKLIFGELAAMARENLAPCEIILYERLEAAKTLEDAGGLATIFHLQNSVETPVSAGYFAAKVMESYQRRMVIRLSRKLQESCLDSGETLAQVKAELARAVKAVEGVAVDRTTMMTGAELSEEARDAYRERVENPESALARVKTGLRDVDYSLSAKGFEPGQLIIIAARPSVGKSALALNIAELNAINGDVPTVFFSMEMRSVDITKRIACSVSNVEPNRIFHHGYQTEYANALHKIERSDFYVDKAPSQTLSNIVAKTSEVADKQKSKGNPLGLVIVDYLQLIKGTNNEIHREQQISEISRGLKELAMRFELPVIALSQINRASEKDNRAPRLSDLRESGSIEQDADTVMFLHRIANRDESVMPTTETIKIIVAKVRNGPIGDHDVTFVKNLTRFENLHGRETGF